MDERYSSMARTRPVISALGSRPAMVSMVGAMSDRRPSSMRALLLDGEDATRHLGAGLETGHGEHGRGDVGQATVLDADELGGVTHDDERHAVGGVGGEGLLLAINLTMMNGTRLVVWAVKGFFSPSTSSNM